MIWPKWYRPARRRVFGFEMVERAAEELGLRPDDITGKGRGHKIVAARAAIVASLRAQGASFPVIGKAINRDHTSVLHLYKVYPTKTRHPQEYRRFLALFDRMRMAA